MQNNVANQGIRQPGYPKNGKKLIKPGDIFVSLKYPNKPVDLIIQQGTIGIFHSGESSTVSIIRDDSKAAKKALRHNLESST